MERVGLPEKNVISLENNAFDDQYVGCEDKMKMWAKKLLDQEREKDLNFNKVWEKAEKEWESMSTEKKTMEKPFEIAVIAYTMDENMFYKDFNQAVRECCKSREAYMNNFHFKAFHFYLTRALQILRGPCYNVYRGVSVKQYPDGTREMRFGQFASTSFYENVARNFANGSGTFYKVYTCKGAKIEHLSVFPHEKEVLIPPYEVFTVSSFSDFEYLKKFEVKSNGIFSKFNCAYLEAPGNKAVGPGQLTTIFFSGVFTLVFQAHSQLLTGF
ncbi:ecto-ADP-ribosyltransferase 5-like isoform X2 [Dromiciops gliroides]|uniref:ecto-ADP-ribosyltransferase 5-like isoform X2 n=1 Tax=Dromiciops gliroides TaxID=33562 RepID=UPI001CC6FCAB|nr:ecto-ADP-ribosyltransferase 5-like isoform X2 [Dromiciops gliroides]